MIDFHSHILPGIDDGAKDEEMAISMIKLAANSGTKKLVATPHYMKGRFQSSRKEVNEELEKLKKKVNELEIPIEIYEGQEVYYSHNILEYYEEGHIGPINGTRYMLVELPMKAFDTEKVINTLYELQIKGLVIILAHPERYFQFIKNPSLINEFLQEGFLFQLNTGSITGDFGKEVKNTAEIFLSHDIYTVVGSDAHRMDIRNTNMTKGLQEANKIKPGIVELFKENGEKILRDEEVISCGIKIPQVKGFKKLIKKIFN